MLSAEKLYVLPDICHGPEIFYKCYEYGSIMAYACRFDCGFQGDKQHMAHYGDCRSLENTLRLLSYASCVLCMCWIKYLSSLFLHIVQLQKFGQNKDMSDLFYLLLVLIVLLKDPVELMKWELRGYFFLTGSFGGIYGRIHPLFL